MLKAEKLKQEEVPTPFLSDVRQLREKARQHIEKGAITPSYEGDVAQAIEILQSVLATEIVCWLRYTMNAVAASGINSESVREEFSEHAGDERQHAEAVAERISQLGGIPDFNPEGLATHSATQYVQETGLAAMIRENLIAERIAVEHYRELIRFFANRDPVTRVLLESILAKEEEHASDMQDLLVAYQGEPPLPNSL